MEHLQWEDAFSVTPGDAVIDCDALYIGGTGTVMVMPRKGSLLVGCRKVLAAGTTATGIVGLRW